MSEPPDHERPSANREQPSEGLFFHVVRGNPTDEEVAAVVAVLTARASAGTVSPPSGVGASGWSAYWRTLRTPLHPGPGAWRNSGRAF